MAKIWQGAWNNSQILVHSDITASWNFCRFVGCISVLWTVSAVLEQVYLIKWPVSESHMCSAERKPLDTPSFYYRICFTKHTVHSLYLSPLHLEIERHSCFNHSLHKSMQRTVRFYHIVKTLPWRCGQECPNAFSTAQCMSQLNTVNSIHYQCLPVPGIEATCGDKGDCTAGKHWRQAQRSQREKNEYTVSNNNEEFIVD